MSNEENTPLQILKTERLTLRPLQISDDHQIFALRSNEDVNRYLGRKPSESIDEARNFIQAIAENQSFYWAITLNGANELIGTICLYNLSDDNQRAEIGYELLPEFQGKGIMHEAISKIIDFAFQHLQLHRLEAYTHQENQASARLLEKLNFKRQDVDEEIMALYTLVSNG
jgi:ribosomal-protein-alanine N-acetyltransferase